jgi:hypothetical protein
MRLALLLLLVTPAWADDDPTFRLKEDGALGADVGGDPLVDKYGDLTACTKKDFPTGSAVFWLDVGKGKVATAKVHGSGSAKVDACLAAALAKGSSARSGFVVTGHLDLVDTAPDHRHDFLPSARLSTTPVLFDPHDAKLQLSLTKIGYTNNRALDIAQAMSDKSDAIAKCAAKRPKPGAGIAWYDGKAIVKSGASGYDACLAAVLESIKLPTAESAVWMLFEVAPPGEPLAAQSDKAMSHSEAVKAEVTTAIRTRKPGILDCVGKAGISRVPIVVKDGVVNLAKTATGDMDIDACLRKKLTDIKIPSATKADAFEWSISLEPE